MAGQDFATLVEAGLLRDVEQITVEAYLAANPGASRPDAYHWLRYEDPEPIARLADGVRKLAADGAAFDATAVEKACAKASKRGYSN
jgi:hypothetical protein